MALPATVRVKLSSESAGYVSMTPVVVRDLPFAELLEYAAAAFGPDPVRIGDILKRGSLVSGASRFRWEGWEADPVLLAAAVARLPHPDPQRPFVPAACTEAILTGPAVRLALQRDFAARRRFLRRRSFWDSLMSHAGGATYVTYLYRERADLYRQALSADAIAMLRTAAPLLTHAATARHIGTAPFTTLDLLTTRAATTI
jgi:hypothetical protein